MIIEWTRETDDGEEIVEVILAKYEVCTRCEGTGKHVNPSIDGNGITASEFAEWDPDEREGYFAGNYDVRCEDCKGLRVELVPDWEALTKTNPELAQAYEDHLDFNAKCDREDRIAAERGY